MNLKVEMRREKQEIQIGHIYRHFKGGLYQVLGIAIHTETGEKMVVYQAQYGAKEMFVRPYDMFVDSIDPKKYPRALQRHRFELVE